MTIRDQSNSDDTPVVVQIKIGLERLVNLVAAECEADLQQIEEVIEMLDALGLLVRSGS